MGKQNLKITAVQYEPVWQEAETNRNRLSKMLANVETDVIVFPEMFTTGFSMDAATQAEVPNGETVDWMKAMAAEKQAVVCGSLIIQDAGKFYNRLFWIEPSGKTSTYDKRHLFNYAGEGLVYTGGTEKLIVEYMGWRICPLICYDLRFPAWSRNQNNYDLLLYVANWPDKRSLHWNSLLLSRAIENQSYVVGVNIVGTDANEHQYIGDTSVLAFDGERLAHLSIQAGLVEVTLDKAAQDAYRQKLPFLKDADSISFQV